MGTKRTSAAPATTNIRIGIGGWVYAPWRGVFYPGDLVQRRELEYASRHVTSIEVNGTYYRAQTEATYAKWAGEVPDGFVFSLKAPRRITASRSVEKVGPQVVDFLGVCCRWVIALARWCGASKRAPRSIATDWPASSRPCLQRWTVARCATCSTCANPRWRLPM